MRLKYTSFLLSLLTAWTIFTLVLPARAGVYTYGASQRTVNAGILLNGAYATAANVDPYPFYILSQRPDVRPYGWNLVNPLAPRSVTSDISTKWGYALGQPVLPSMAAYWEVRLSDAAAADLAQYDVLLINLSQSEAFTAADSEKLRRYVDGGGVLWIEQSRAGGNVSGGPLFSPLNNLSFIASGGSITLTGAPARPPILTTPYALSEQEITQLGYGQNGQWSHMGGLPLLQSILMAGGDALSVEPLGAGIVVVSSTQCVNAINDYANPTVVGNGGAFCGLNYSAAPSGDLKLMCNIIASSGAGPHEHQNAHQQGGSANSLTAAVLSWTFPVQGGTVATSPVINGNITYVVDAAGNLDAFDTDPSEDLDSDGNPDDGIQDFSLGTPYDEVWQVPAKTLGANTSSPTVAYDPKNGVMGVFVEKKDGTVQEFNATVMGGFVGSYGSATSPGYGSANAPGPAPAPTVYNGFLFAGQADGSLFVEDLANTANTAVFKPNIDYAQNSGTEFVTAPPSVGIQTENQRGADTNDIIAYVTTNHGLYTVFCGARGEALVPVPVTVPMGYNTKLQSLKPTGNAYGRVANNSILRTYTLSSGFPSSAPLMYNNSPPTDFTNSAGTSVFADYDVNFAATIMAVMGGDTGPLTRTGYSISSQTRTQGVKSDALVSAPALDRNGNAYFTSNDTANPGSISLSSSLLCVHDSATPSLSAISWRFRLPGATESITDADNTSYAPLQGFHFVGSPVVDGQGNVYALAVDGAYTAGTGFAAGTQAAVLCFNGLGPITLDVFGVGLAQSIASATYTQPFGTGGDLSEFGEPLAPIGPQQYVDRDSSGHLTLVNFGMLTGMNGRELSPNLSEPQPITVQYTPSSGPTSTGASTLTSTTAPLHTNLNWFVVTGAAGATGLTLAGNRLYFGDGGGNIYKVVADPLAEGVTITNKLITAGAVTTDGTTMVSSAGNAGVGAVGGSLSSADGLLMVNGLTGVSCFADRTTLVVEAGRVMEVDADGQATWVVDSTTQPTTQGGSTLLQNGTTYASLAATPTGQTVTTDINLNHPASVTQLTRNDYLVADSGNNRVVRFDRSGNVIWELTKFTDPNKMMTAGEPNTLNQPTSVQIFRQTVKDASGKVTEYITHYLVADSGNNRILEVTDTFNASFTQIDPVTTNPTHDHQLTWISRTADKQGRQYRYASASYFSNATTGNPYVIALVTNTRIATPPGTPGALAPANQDAPGGSVVLLDYVPVDTTTSPSLPQTPQKGGYISSVFSSIQAYLTPAKRFDVTSGATGTAGANATLTTLQVRNPRYLKPYTSVTAGQRFLLADDNGVFDLTPPATTSAPFVASWGFTQADYQAMQVPVTGTTAFVRTTLPFVPTCVQKLTATDKLAASGDLVSHYLITSGYAQGESVAAGLPRIGGEAFETSVDASGAFQTDSPTGGFGGFGGRTLSLPGNTSPLEQPTFAYRLQ